MLWEMLRLRGGGAFFTVVITGITMVCAAALIFSALGPLADYRRAAAVSKKKDGIMRLVRDYDRLSSKACEVYYTDGNYDKAVLAESIASAYLPLLEKEMGLSEPVFAVIVLFSAREEMYFAIGYDASDAKHAETGGLEPAGAYSGGVAAIYAGAKHSVFLKTLIHELSHLALDKKTNGSAAEWFSEGVALYYEQKYAGSRTESAAYSALNEKVSYKVSYKKLAGAFAYVDKREGLRKSLAIVRFIEKNGALSDMFNALEKGVSTDRALRTLLKEKYRRLNGL